MVLKAGELRHRLTFLIKESVDGKYSKEEKWRIIVTVKAKVTQPRTDESDVDHGVSRKVKIVAFIRYRSDINENDRLVFNDTEYEISSCRDANGMRKQLIIEAYRRS